MHLSKLKVFKLSDLSKEKRELYEDLYKSNPIYVKPFDDYDENGLRFTLEHLRSVGGYLIFAPLEHMAEYVDEKTKIEATGENPMFLESILRDFLKKGDYKNYNATSLGNIAYVHMYSNNRVLEEVSLEILEAYQSWFVENHGKELEEAIRLLKVISRIKSGIPK